MASLAQLLSFGQFSLLSYCSRTAARQAGKRKEVRRQSGTRAELRQSRRTTKRDIRILALWGRRRATSRGDATLLFLPSFFSPSPLSFRPPSSGRNWADDLNARMTTNGSPPLAPLTARRRSVSRASTGRRFAVCGLRADQLRPESRLVLPPSTWLSCGTCVGDRASHPREF